MSNEAVRIKKRNDIASRISTYLVLALVAILCAGPFIWLVLSSLRTGANIYDLHFSLKNFTLSNYTGVIRYMNLGKYVGNTVIITVVGIVIDVVFLRCVRIHWQQWNLKAKILFLECLLQP